MQKLHIKQNYQQNISQHNTHEPQLLSNSLILTHRHTHTHTRGHRQEHTFPLLQRTLHWLQLISWRPTVTLTRTSTCLTWTRPYSNIKTCLHLKIQWLISWIFSFCPERQIPIVWLCKQILVPTTWVITRTRTLAHTQLGHCWLQVSILDTKIKEDFKTSISYWSHTLCTLHDRHIVVV